MNYVESYNNPLKIICLTEESVETLFHIGKGDLVAGVSSFVKRPHEATKLPKISLFTSSKVDKICEMKPDLVLGFSDIQKDIAAELIDKGLDVWIANHRTIAGILKYIATLSSIVGAPDQGKVLIQKLLDNISRAEAFSENLTKRPKVYFEEWDEPMITAIEWVNEIIELCGGESITSNIAHQKKAMDRVVTPEFVLDINPDIIFGCWCGKKVKIDAIKNRSKWDSIKAVQNKNVYELPPEIFLQPGPAVLLDGIDILINYFSNWEKGEK